MRVARVVHLSGKERIVLLVFFLAIPFIIAGCGKGDARGTEDRAEADTLAAADSLTSEEADSTELAPKGSKSSLLGRLFGRGKDEEEEEDEPVPVELAPVEIRDVPSYIGATATLEPEKRANIVAKIAGEIWEIRVEEGDRVRRNQVLALLDGEAQRVALEEAAARERGLKLDFERVESLFEQDLVSTKEMNDSRSRFEEAVAQRKATELEVSYTRIVAPFSGQVSRRHVDPGQNVGVGAELFAIVDCDPLLARVHLPEKKAARLEPGQKVIISPDANKSLVMEGEILLIAPIVDSRTGTIKVTCRMSGHDAALRPGSFVRVRLQTDKHENVLVIPKRALVPEGGESWVYKAVADSVVKIPVGTGYTDDEYAEITSGLAAGERVITVGQGGLRSGSKYRDIAAENEEAPTEEPADTTDETSRGS